MALVACLITVAIAHAQPGIPRAAHQYRRPLTAAARLVFGLTAPTAVLFAQVHQESGFRADARSPYANGLAQFTPATAADMGRWYPELAEVDAFNPSWALRALVRLDRRLWDLEPRAATLCDRMALTLSAFNGGRGWVIKQKAAAAAGGSDSTRWFSHVERYRVRALWAHEENMMYPRRILLQRQPIYLSWGLGVDCSQVSHVR